MAFIDGENFTLRTQDVAESKGLLLKENDYYAKDTFFWIPGVHGTFAITKSLNDNLRLQEYAIRSYYYVSVCGDQDTIDNIKAKIWKCGFSPNVFKKRNRADKAKGVDIALTIDMLSHAYMNNYDVAVLYSGDGDYAPVVREVKRLGKAVFVCAFENSGLSKDLRLVSDEFLDMGLFFDEIMNRHKAI